MQTSRKLIARFITTILLGVIATTTQADSSSASSVASQSVGSSSKSIEKSVQSSFAKDKVTQGQYTITEIAEVADKSDLLRIKLQAIAADQSQDFYLLLPRNVMANTQLDIGDRIEARHREYGAVKVVIG